MWSHRNVGNSSAVRDAARLQARRLRAVTMVGRGASQAEVARRLGVTREAVRQWVTAWREGGRTALAARPRRKRARVPLTRVARLVQRTLGRPNSRLTTERLRRLIHHELGVAYSPSNVRSILHRLGLEYERVPGWRPAA
ncbi:MAG TPA: helix-turn-helix domain-containing protein [Polyangiaceae bacterium]|nr:helix-turn-helix domain-containing protein [Polyangiaceae bacterium]